MKARRRLSPQQIQENISRKGFAELLERHEWVTGDITLDLGEDILVRIFDNGISTGITFYIQLKSTQNIKKLRLKSGNVSYPFEVADLEHWEAQGVPVLLVIWDISIKQGCYIWASEAIKFLNSKNKGWHAQSKVKVHFPQSNIFNDDSFIKLRQDLAKYYYPVIAQNKDMAIKVSLEFPPTIEGKAKLAEFEKYLASGDEVELEGKFIKEFDLPDWWERLFGRIDPSNMNLKIGPSKQALVVPFQFDFFSSNAGIIRLPHVELRLEKKGEEETTISNMHQKIPIKVKLVLNNRTNQLQVNFTLNFSNIDGYQAREAVKIQQILSEAAQLRLKNLENGEETTYSSLEGNVLPPDPSVLDFVDKVCSIQDEIGTLLTFPNSGSFTTEDENAANELVSIFREGKFKQTRMKFSAEFRKPAIELLISNLKEAKALSFRIVTPNSHVNVLGKKIELGSMTQYVKGMWDATYNEVKRWTENASDKDLLKVTINDAEIIEEFENWPRNQFNVN